MTDPIKTQELATAFIEALRAELGADKWAEMRRLNATPDFSGDFCCASHNFCDANMVMHYACEQIGIKTVLECDDGTPEHDAACAIWNAAWSLAKAQGMTARNFEANFPDFPAEDMPATPEGFEDVSWYNDTCPSFMNEPAGLIYFVDFSDVEKREIQEPYPRFCLKTWDGGTTDEVIAESDDFDDILAAIAARKAA